MKNLFITRQSLGCALGRGLAIVFGITALRTLSGVLAVIYRYTSGTASVRTLSFDLFLPEIVEILLTGLFALWLWGRAEHFLPVDNDEADNAVAISPGLITQGVLLALAIYLIVPAASRMLEATMLEPRGFRWHAQWDHSADILLAIILFAASFIAGRRVSRTVAPPTLGSTDQHQQLPEHAVAQTL